MKRNVPNKIYEVVLTFTAVLVILNIIGLWVTWTTGNCLGFVAGGFVIAFLLADTILAFLNQKPSARKHAVIWILFLVLHIVFFALATYVNQSEDKAIPALFTVLLVAMIVVIGWILLRHRIVKSRKSYQLVNDDKTETVEHKETHEFNNTVKIEREEDKELTEQIKEEPESTSTGVISL